MKRDYFEGADVAVTICAKDGTILDMNAKSRRTFLKPGSEELIGKNVLDCHPEPARSLLADMGDFTAMNGVYAQFFSEPFPARSAVAVKTLPKGALVEIECIASRS